jgi:hypothetical protein
MSDHDVVSTEPVTGQTPPDVPPPRRLQRVTVLCRKGKRKIHWAAVDVDAVPQFGQPMPYARTLCFNHWAVDDTWVRINPQVLRHDHMCRDC